MGWTLPGGGFEMVKFFQSSAIVALALILVKPASATSLTYIYTGSDYTTYYASNLENSGLHTPFSQAEINGFALNLGPHMSIILTLSVTFGNLSGPLNGTYSFLQGGSGLGFDYVSSTNLVSGNAVGSTSAVFADWVTFVNGEVSAWKLITGAPNPCGTMYPIQFCEFGSSSADGDYVRATTGYSGIRFEAIVNRSGTWTNLTAAPVPGPVVGAGVSGLLTAVAGFIGWRRSRRTIAA